MASTANASPTMGAGSPKPPGAPRGRALMNSRGMAARREVQPTPKDDPGKMAFGDFEWSVDDVPSSPPSSNGGGGSKQQTPASSRSGSRDESAGSPSERTSRGSSLGNEPYPRRPSSPNNPKPTTEGRSGRLGWGSPGPTASSKELESASPQHRNSTEEVYNFSAGIRPKTPPKVDSAPHRENSTEPQSRQARLHPTFLVEEEVRKERQPLELSGSGSTNSNPEGDRNVTSPKTNLTPARGSGTNLASSGFGRSLSFGAWGSAGAAWSPMSRRGSASGGGGTPTQKVEEEIEYETLSFGDVEYKVPKRKEQANHQRHSLVSAMVDEMDIAVLAKDLNQKEEERLLDENGDTNSLGSGGDDLESETNSEELEAELLKPADENDMVPTATTVAAAAGLNDSPMNASAKSQLQHLGHSGRLGQSPSSTTAAPPLVPAREANPITFFGDFSLTDDSSDGNPMSFGRGKGAADEKGPGDGKPTFAFGDFGAADGVGKQISPGNRSLSFSGSKRSGLLPPILNWEIYSFLGHSGRVRSLVSCDAKDAHIVSTGGDQRSVTARREGFPHLVARYSPHKGIVLHTSISADGRFLATSGNDEVLCVHDNQTSKRLAVMRHPEAVTCSAFADNGRFIITGCHDGICRLYSVQGAGPLRTVTFSKDSIITCVALHPTGEFAASGSSEGNVFVWRSASGALIPMCQEHTLKRQVILQVAFTRKGSLLAVLDRFMLTFTLVPSGHPVLTVKSQDIPFITTRLSEAGLNVSSKGKAGKRFLSHHTGGPGHPSGNPAPAEFQFTAMHCGQVDNRIRSLPEGCVALAGNDREVRCYDFSGFFEEYEHLHASLVQESKPTPQTTTDQAKKAKRLSSANPKSLDRNDHEAVEDSFVPQAVLEKPLLSFTCRGSPCAMSPGRSGALLVGDVHGNITILRVNHTTGYKEKPPPSELAKIRREKALSSPPKGMS